MAETPHKRFPVLPWRAINNPTYIKCKNGGTLLTSGWCTSLRSLQPS